MTTPLFMGRSLYNRFLHIELNEPGNMLTFARSGGGKGVSAVIPNLLSWPHSAVVIDVKGTNAAVTARYRRTLGPVYIVDPFEVLGRTSDGFNPLARLDLDSREVREDIGVIADALVAPDPLAHDKHWDQSSKAVLAGLLTELRTKEGLAAALPTVRRMLALHGEQEGQLWGDMERNTAGGGLAQEAAARVIRRAGTNELLSVMANLDRHTHWLSSPAMTNVLSTSTFSFAEMKERPTTIYLILPPHYLDEHSRFLRLFINQALRQMSKGGRSKVPVLMLLDEFLSLSYMEEIARAFTLMRSYNLVLWPFIQDLGRFKDLYRNGVNSIIGNSRAVQVFGIDDPETLTYVSDRLGPRVVREAAKPARVVPLRTPSEVALEINVESGYQYVLRSGRAPLLLERVKYYEDRSWKANVGLPDALMRRWYPFWKRYDPDPDFAS